MEFKDMKKIWDSESQAHMYAINEQQLAENIRNKKRSAGKMVNRLEWFLILANLGAGLFLLVTNLDVSGKDPFTYLLSGFMLIMSGFLYYRHHSRLNQDNRFDRSMLGDLKHAISSATYQARLSYLMLLFILPVAIIVLLSSWANDKPLWFIVVAGTGFVIVFFAARWEHRSIHLARKQKLEDMLNRLTRESE